MNELGSVMRSARMSAGLSLSAMSARTHYSKALLGHLEIGQRTILPEHVRAYEDVLGVDLDRLAAVARKPRRVDSESLTDIATILATTRRLEDTIGPQLVVTTIRGLRDLTLSAVGEAGARLEAPAASLASEISQYLGWLELSTGNAISADRQLDRAIALAEQAKDSDRLFHGLSFKAFTAQHRQRNSEAIDYAEAASRVNGAHPRLRTYNEYDLARLLALTGETVAAQRRLLSADRTADSATDVEPPDSGYWYTDGFWGLERGHVLAILGQEESARREAEGGFAAMPLEHRETEWAVDLFDRVQRAIEGQAT
ncbi:helix-turn-helix domain-containing protein [Kibdelosporangium persicum]|uniref:helix-turn-helix domain-containing protein n=1 Tax=Kibdelosporangium persicum TaxID=2698649 RepID=UPI0015653124|nr:helix-turn-helix domain-containing protein [Kibdelosporangium persicum]